MSDRSRLCVKSNSKSWRVADREGGVCERIVTKAF